TGSRSRRSTSASGARATCSAPSSPDGARRSSCCRSSTTSTPSSWRALWPRASSRRILNSAATTTCAPPRPGCRTRPTSWRRHEPSLMTRIVAGSARGRRLRTPAGERTRPTADRVREALFSALESALGSLEGLRVLDLYAGSGAVGLEAMSRGAGVATLVEADRRTARLVQQNADALGFRRAEVVAAPVEKAVALPPRAPYDVAFL